MIKGYYFITDSSLSRRDILSDVKNAVEAGTRVIQYRSKNSNTMGMVEEAKKLRRICKDSIFLVNDRVDVALAAGADGVHLGQNDMPYELARCILGKDSIIGITVHNVKEAKQAENMGADYLGLSPIFTTSTKSDAGKPCGVEMIRKIKKSCSIPIVAIGGINLENAPEVIKAGADSVCAISAVVASDDIKESIRKIQELFR